MQIEHHKDASDHQSIYDVVEDLERQHTVVAAALRVGSVRATAGEFDTIIV